MKRCTTFLLLLLQVVCISCISIVLLPVFSATVSEQIDSFVTKQCVMNKLIHLKPNEKIIVRSQSDHLPAKRIGPTNRADEQGRRPRRGWHFEVRGKCIGTILRSKAEHLVLRFAKRICPTLG